MGLAILYSSIPLLGTVLVARYFSHEGLEWVVFFLLVTELVFLLGIEIDLLVLRGKSGLATFRRLATVSIVSNLLWLAVSLAGLLAYSLTGSDAKLFSLIFLGAFFAISFRATIFGSVFYGSPILGLGSAIVQPLLLLPSVLLVLNLSQLESMNTLFALVGGLVAIAGIEIYLELINKPVKGLKALKLLQAFLKAWTVGNPADLENYFQMSSEETCVTTEILRLTGDDDELAALLVVPGIHPGPFSPVGSSNLPGDIYEKMRSENEIPVIFHSISDHELNLPSKEEVRKYAKSLENQTVLEQGRTMTLPGVVTEGKATALGFALGKTLLVALTLAPNGMEDLPGIVRTRIEESSRKAGFNVSLVVDSHNSLGEKPSDSDTTDLIRASSKLIDRLAGDSQTTFRFGFAHSSEIESFVRASDIGPAGVGLLFFEVEKTPFCLVVADANNASLGFRETVIKNFQEKTSENLVEICTSDTHVTAAKAHNAKGYFALGDLTSPETFSSLLEALLVKAKSRLSSGAYEASLSSTSVRTIGGQILDNFSGLLDESAFIAKRGAQILGILAVVVTLAVALA